MLALPRIRIVSVPLLQYKSLTERVLFVILQVDGPRDNKRNILYLSTANLNLKPLNNTTSARPLNSSSSIPQSGMRGQKKTQLKDE